MEQVFLDLDMSIVGSSQQDYKEYSQKVRKEYSHFKDEDFFKGRLAFLETIKGKQIFKSDLFMELNEQSQKNIEMEIQELKDRIESEIQEDI